MVPDLKLQALSKYNNHNHVMRDKTNISKEKKVKNSDNCCLNPIEFMFPKTQILNTILRILP